MRQGQRHHDHDPKTTANSIRTKNHDPSSVVHHDHDQRHKDKDKDTKTKTSCSWTVFFRNLVLGGW